MGIYLNPGNENFVEITNAKIYVDKTLMLNNTNKIMNDSVKYVCISRPRRFGKTVASNMLCAYYSKGCDSRELFSRFKISKEEGYEKNLNAFNVIKLDINSEYRNILNKEQLVFKITDNLRSEFSEQFPSINFSEEDSIADCIVKVFSKTGEQFVILMDEYDVLVRENVPDSLFNQYLDLLNGLFKSDTLRPAIALAYLTGILPIVRDKIQSKLNNFDEYTILSAGKLSEYTGFTTEEVLSLCQQFKIDFDECKNWYDGYRLAWYDGDSRKTIELYNPESVVKTMLNHEFGNYWNKTSSYEVISDRIRQNFAGTKDDVIRMISGESIDVDVGMYKNTVKDFTSKDDIFTYLIHLGYLAYNAQEQQCFIPNKEVRLEWMRAVSIIDEYAETDRIIKASKELLTEVLSGNAQAVEKSLNESHIHVTSNRSYNNEYALQSAIYLSFIYALNKYACFKELTTGKGYADVVYLPLKNDLPALIIELKHNQCAETALNQIKEKKYFDSVKSYKGDILFIGINYDEKEKTHECKIEKFIKE